MYTRKHVQRLIDIFMTFVKITRKKHIFKVNLRRSEHLQSEHRSTTTALVSRY